MVGPGPRAHDEEANEEHTGHDLRRTQAPLTSGYYPPDASLVPLARSEEFAVSRTPVREALALLERDGLLVPTRRGFALRLRSDEEMLELFEVQAVLDATAAASAALRRGPVDLARLDALLDHAQSLDDPTQIRRSLNDWHDTVRQAAHNGTVVAFRRPWTRR
ncbi:FCD domain-containing protein [Streptomyces sp. NPDC088253]|uniref:FCD domain-containing protein n=1 Tax=Streptomyces sp. NPDC088253 TaxID=3365846 RepID=UPI003802ABB1